MLSKTSSVLRYPGGKRRMLVFLRDHLPAASTIAGSYVEPFLGGGAIFFFVQPSRAILSDVNSELIDIYKGIRFAPRKVWKLYCDFGNTKEDYFHVRDNATCKNLPERAARMLYLNRTCFKGMWRHNNKGGFNVGYGGEERRWVISEAELLSVSQLLRHKTIVCTDFEKIINNCRINDFLFLDPPYRPGEKEHTNSHYNWQRFTYNDHQRLANALHQAKQSHIRWALTTSSHCEITRLFRGNYAIDVPRGTGRMPGISTANSGEVLITNYQTEGCKKL
ncbi:MAG: DNA adenine methylase [Caldilineaceae bacterium]